MSAWDTPQLSSWILSEVSVEQFFYANTFDGIPKYGNGLIITEHLKDIPKLYLGCKYSLF